MEVRKALLSDRNSLEMALFLVDVPREISSNTKRRQRIREREKITARNSLIQ
jgi:hypothetical protein